MTSIDPSGRAEDASLTNNVRKHSLTVFYKKSNILSSGFIQIFEYDQGEFKTIFYTLRKVFLHLSSLVDTINRYNQSVIYYQSLSS